MIVDFFLLKYSNNKTMLQTHMLRTYFTLMVYKC